MQLPTRIPALSIVEGLPALSCLLLSSSLGLALHAQTPPPAHPAPGNEPVTLERLLVTADLWASPLDRIPASVTVIQAERIERLGEPLVPALLRLTPSLAVSASGPAGSNWPKQSPAGRALRSLPNRPTRC